ncbi:MAG: hypothetical protein HYS13_15950 [Planctomycetia bacterium]|nr:hypothetical protein [Planctomycetia bacterium]
MPSAARPISRRQFFARAGACAAAAGFPQLALGLAGDTQPVKPRPKIAAVFTELRFRSHAYNILENFFAPYLFCGKLVDPGVDVVSFYADQFPEGDMARGVSQKLGVPLFDAIDKTLCLGGERLAVDGVLLIGEHGEYPVNELGQKLYPRKEFFDKIVAVMERSGRFVPVFSDKHLSYRWDFAKEMYDTARRHKFPLMAGSSVPLAERRPPLELPGSAKIEWAVAVHGGAMEVYDFHGLEVLQSLVEAREGGETGVARIEFVEGDALKDLLKREPVWRELLDSAMAAETAADLKKLRQPRPRLPADSSREAPPDDPAEIRHALLVDYRDGLRAAVFAVGHSADRWNFACKLRGQSKHVATTFFNGPWGNRCLFKALSHAIQSMFKSGKTPYPIERTLLSTGALAAAMISRHERKPQDTPQLAIRYDPVDFRAVRESGASWKVITKDVPQPQDFLPGDERFLRP